MDWYDSLEMRLVGHSGSTATSIPEELPSMENLFLLLVTASPVITFLDILGNFGASIGGQTAGAPSVERSPRDVTGVVDASSYTSRRTGDRSRADSMQRIVCDLDRRLRGLLLR
jgi:hypothetical protein